jgi:hypothetical protein
MAATWKFNISVQDTHGHWAMTDTSIIRNAASFEEALGRFNQAMRNAPPHADPDAMNVLSRVAFALRRHLKDG